MGTQDTMFPFSSIQLERQMVGIQSLFTMSDQGPQRIGPDQLVQGLGVGNGKMGWLIHKGSLSEALASMQKPILAQSGVAGDGIDIKKRA